MSFTFKVFLWVMLVLALAFGFMHLVIPDFPLDFQRLHVFFFNLCVGGGLILYLAQGRDRIGPLILAWFAVSMAYGLSAFFEQYWLTLVLTLPLLAMAERERVRIFPWFPVDFFRGGAVARKFQHAAMLCLSMGLIIAGLVIVNNEYLHLFHRPKLTLDVFFLGYSFPISLTTFYLLFGFMPRRQRDRLYRAIGEYSFWSINLGVIIFFVFIIFELPVAEMAIATLLFLSVVLVLVHFARYGQPTQQKVILLSGMAFLVFTGLTGLLYILKYTVPAVAAWDDYFLTLHSTVALYGWNLSGLFIILREKDFPTRLHSWIIVSLQWSGVFFLTPLGKYNLVFAVPALVIYAVLVGLVAFVPSRLQRAA